MANFTVTLPGDIAGDVYKGRVFERSIGFTRAWPFIRPKGEGRIGYVIKLNNSEEYHLQKTPGGLWPVPGGQFVTRKKENRWVATEETGIVTDIKNAIDGYENK